MEMKKYKLSEYLDSFGDGIHGTPKYDEYGDYYFINGNNLNDGKIEITSKTLKVSANEYEKIKRNLNEKSLLVSINGTLGNIAFYNGERIALGKSACFLNLKESSCREYLRYVLETKEFKSYMNRVAGQSTIKNVSPTQISEFEFYAPPLPTQQKIAAVLSSLDDKIALNKKINAKLEAMAKRLYDYWFVQFDYPDKNGKPYKTSGGKMVWNEVLKREIPEGWEVGNITKVAAILSGGTPSKANAEYWNGKIPFLGPTDYEGNVFQLSTEAMITEEGLNKCASILFDENTVILTSRGSVGKLVIIGIPMAMNQSCYALKANNNNQYEYLYFLTIQLIESLKVKSSGSVFKSIIISDIENSMLSIGNATLVDSFCNVVKPMFIQIKKNTKEIKKLTDLRDHLLPLLMNGQVEVVEE